MPMPMPTGIYNGGLVGATCCKNVNDKPYLALSFALTHAYVHGEWQALPNEEVRDYRIYLTAEAWDFAQDRLKWLGFNGQFDAPRFYDWVYQNVALKCEHEQRDGKTYERWLLNDYGSPVQAEPLDMNDINKLNARWNVRAQGAPVGAPAPTPPQQPAMAAAPQQPAAPQSAPTTFQPRQSDYDPPF